PAAHGIVSLELAPFTLAPLGAFPMPMTGQRARLELSGDRLDLTRPIWWRSFVAVAEGGAIPDLQLLEALLPPHSGVRIESGQATVTAHMEGTPNAAHGRVDFTAHEATASLGRTRVRASLHGEVRLQENGP